MKPLLICILLIIHLQVSKGQLKVDAGNDTTFCMGLFNFQPDTAFLGEYPPAVGGEPPYTYNWSCEVKLSETLTFTASDFLHDTNAIHENLIDRPDFKVINDRDYLIIRLDRNVRLHMQEYIAKRYNMQGQLIVRKKFIDTLNIPMSSVPSQMCVIRIRHKQKGILFTRKIRIL